MFGNNAIIGGNPTMNSLNQGIINTSSKGVNRDWFSANFGGADEIAYEDWMRSELSQDNQLQRDLYFQSKSNAFNASEAQKQRDYDREMRDTSYTSMINQLKDAGINPVLAVQHGASYAGGTSASSSGGRTSNRNLGDGFVANGIGQLLGVALSLGAGLISNGLVGRKKFKVGF